MKTSVVILNYNGQEMLRKYLPILKTYTPETELIVADNASTDGSRELLSTEFPEIKTILLKENYGFAGGYNHALKGIETEYYLLLNSDIEVTKGWLTTLEEFMDAHPDVAACQPKLRSMADKTMFEYAGASGGFIDKYGYPFCRGRIFDVVEKDQGQYDEAVEVMWATGAALMIRRADWEKSGGFDNRFFAHNEEIDLCWRLRLMDRKIFVVPQSVVYHIGGATLNKSNPRKTFLNFRNNLLMLYKNLPDKDLKRVMCIRWFLDYLAAWQTLLLNGKVGDFKAIYKARKAFKAMRTREGSITSNTLLKPYSILAKYYIKGIKKYTELN